MAGTKDTKQQCKKTKKNDVGEVMINVSLMKLSKGVLKSVKWKSRTLRVATDSRKSQLLTKAIDKHSAHDRTFNRYAGYTLAYPDGSEILTLPDRPTEIFQLDKYKEDVGKTYNRITFFLVLRDDIANEGKDSDTEPELWMNGDVYEGSVKLMWFMKWGSSNTEWFLIDYASVKWNLHPIPPTPISPYRPRCREGVVGI